MEKNCIHCGAALDDDARFCGSCGQPRGTVEAGAVQPEPQAALQPEADARPMSAARPAKEPKKSRRKLLLIGGIAAGAAVLAAVFFLFILPSITGGASGQEMIVFSEGGSNYYVSPYLFKLNGDGDPIAVSVENGGEVKQGPIGLYAANVMAKSGTTIYARHFGEIEKLTFTASDCVRLEAWMTEEDFENSSFGEGLMGWCNGIRNLSTDGDYLYFNIIPGVDNRLIQGSIVQKMGRISLNTKEITEIEGISAIDYVIDDGWIYFIDNGFYHDDTTGNYGLTDYNRTGVYKARTDGSGRQLLRTLSWGDAQPVDARIADELKLIDGKLYYLDYSAEGLGRVCRMSTSGSGVEYVTEKAAFRYAVDTDRNAVYYTVGDYKPDVGAYTGDGNNPEFRRCASGSDVELPYFGYSDCEFVYSDGYLYFSDPGVFRFSRGDGVQTDAVCGFRMNTATGRFQKLIGYNDSQTERTIDPNTGRRVIKMTDGENHLYWEDAEATLASERGR